MNSQRAQEIINSQQMINVNYHGVPVYIQNVNPNDETATVFPLDEMKNEQEVDLEGLIEEGP
ncbi:H-type small acid-soluble spore protein [Bacillus shivajii]|uniref:H-type small acid-soluble spore protein n=1 Tax=Bacillus shivajii TaxID=1983719 RepID=UPI001CFA1146|nr:H-type small acid-soluble spore protein [Bacillus shivajii]UCZ53174.1 H-type small acid-soluble spore protein [Bacillus shivajii]